MNGKRYAMTGINAYAELATVFKRASPGLATPGDPPAGSFAGDSLGLTLSSDSGSLVIAGTGPTSAGTVLEISTVSLKSRARRTPRAGYVSRGFFTLTQANNFLAFVPVGPGVFAVRARYVSKATGQTTTDRGLGRATVLQVVEGGANVDQETGEVTAAPKRGGLKWAA